MCMGVGMRMSMGAAAHIGPALTGRACTPSLDASQARSVTAETLYDAIRQPVPAPWMVPPCQRAGPMGAFSKFVA